jgi:uncharacterized membrane protein
MLQTLVFSARNWAWFAALATLIALSMVAWNYRPAPRGPAKWICILLRTLALVALALCLLEPLWAGQRARPGANLFAVVADNSQGMQIKDNGQTQSRGEVLKELLNSQRSSWLPSLEENFEVRKYFFDSRIQNTRDFSELVFDGRSSAIGSSLRALAERYRGRPLAGILLLTDGNATDITGAPDISGLPPIYPVVMGSQDAIQDVAVEQVTSSQTDFEDAPVSILAAVRADGYPGEPIVTRITDRAGKVVAEQTQRARGSSDAMSFRFQLRPEKPGIVFYRLSAGLKSELDQSITKPTSEATLANNSRVLVVDRGHGPHRILYVAGRPNWEFKFLNRALDDDDQLLLTGLIRVAKREPKFTFMGRSGEVSNPLFRGFTEQGEVESYDKPVLVPINPRDNYDLRTGFPRTAEDLYPYHAIIVDDLEADFFTPDQQALLQRFVSERGGGFLMLGGMECFQEGKYARTPIGDMLPVYLDHPETTNAPGPLHLNLTREGWLQPWARLRDKESDEKARLQSMPAFQVLNRVREAKPGASVIATVTDQSGATLPALVVQRFGRGRTGALMVGDIWRWGFHDADSHTDMDKAWRQLTRWLVTDVPNLVEITAEPPADDAGKARLAELGPDARLLRVRVRDPKFLPLDNAAVTIQVQPVMAEAVSGQSSNVIRLEAEAVTSEPGLYEASYIPRLTGGYEVTAFATNSAGAEVGRAATGWSTDLAAEEFKSLKPNLSLLESLAQKTGGEVIPAARLNQFCKSLPNRNAPVMEAWTYPLWHTPAWFGFALACLVSEWGLRRWKGMP